MQLSVHADGEFSGESRMRETCTSGSRTEGESHPDGVSLTLLFYRGRILRKKLTAEIAESGGNHAEDGNTSYTLTPHLRESPIPLGIVQSWGVRSSR